MSIVDRSRIAGAVARYDFWMDFRGVTGRLLKELRTELRANLDRLLSDGDDVNRMMSIGLHPRISGNPGRSDGLARFIDYAQSRGDVWFARRLDIANTFIEQQPADRWI